MSTSPLTPFGQFTRKLRVDHDEYLKDMAKRLDVTYTYLSAVERGRRNVPQGWTALICEAYELSAPDSKRLEAAAAASRVYDRLDIAHLDDADKRLMGRLAKELPSLDDASRDALTDNLDGCSPTGYDMMDS